MLSERDVLNLMGWPSREFVNARIRTSKFPRPTVRYRGIGDQWRESDIKRWRDGAGTDAKSEREQLLERFS